MSGLEMISISAQPERLSIDKAHGRVLVMQRFAGVLLEMQAFDADFDGTAVASTCTEPSPTTRCLYCEIW